jgi:hypothetical protein
MGAKNKSKTSWEIGAKNKSKTSWEMGAGTNAKAKNKRKTKAGPLAPLRNASLGMTRLGRLEQMMRPHELQQ